MNWVGERVVRGEGEVECSSMVYVVLRAVQLRGVVCSVLCVVLCCVCCVCCVLCGWIAWWVVLCTCASAFCVCLAPCQEGTIPHKPLLIHSPYLIYHPIFSNCTSLHTTPARPLHLNLLLPNTLLQSFTTLSFSHFLKEGIKYTKNGFHSYGCVPYGRCR